MALAELNLAGLTNVKSKQARKKIVHKVHGLSDLKTVFIANTGQRA